MVIKIIYTLFLSLLIVGFVGLGIDAFYPGPKYPEATIALQMDIDKPTCSSEETADMKAQREDYTKAQKTYQEQSKTYNRNVSMISLAASIIILILSLTLLAKINMIADGILLGGVFTNVYGIIRGLMAGDSKFRFLIIVIGLIIALILGYIKFIRPKKTYTNIS
jgi:hypothetical protein